MLTMAPPGSREAKADPRPAPGARRARSEPPLRHHPYLGDLFSILLAWGLPLLVESRLRPDRTVAVWLAAAVSTLVVMKMAGLYRSWIPYEFSRQAVRIIAATIVGGFALVAAGWLASFL